MLDPILADFKATNISTQIDVILLINAFGATPLMELYLIYNCIARYLFSHGIIIAQSLVGNYTTALDMAGASITICLLDDEIKQHWASPVHTAALRW